MKRQIVLFTGFRPVSPKPPATFFSKVYSLKTSPKASPGQPLNGKDDVFDMYRYNTFLYSLPWTVFSPIYLEICHATCRNFELAENLECVRWNDSWDKCVCYLQIIAIILSWIEWRMRKWVESITRLRPVVFITVSRYRPSDVLKTMVRRLQGFLNFEMECCEKPLHITGWNWEQLFVSAAGGFKKRLCLNRSLSWVTLYFV